MKVVYISREPGWEGISFSWELLLVSWLGCISGEGCDRNVHAVQTMQQSFLPEHRVWCVHRYKKWRIQAARTAATLQSRHSTTSPQKVNKRQKKGEYRNLA